jgi:hypothetical protein
VGLTVFKTAGGSLGAAPGGFDSHTPLPLHIRRSGVPLSFYPWSCRCCKAMLPFRPCKTMLPFDPLERPSSTEELRASGIRTRSRPAVSLRVSARLSPMSRCYATSVAEPWRKTRSPCVWKPVAEHNVWPRRSYAPLPAGLPLSDSWLSLSQGKEPTCVI